MSGRFDDATWRQIQAADPVASTWLSANAGSGKTRVLTDRVARLLLNDVPPQNILCLTYTKAAASEMQNRLFKRLGEWAMKDDAPLREALAGLGIAETLGEETLAKARRLFARAIETPGGLKIQTIHSFCAGLLRRFPLEAGVSPGFTELDDDARRDLQMEVLDELAVPHPKTMADMAVLVSDADMTSLAAEIASKRLDFPDIADLDQTLALVGLPAGFTPEVALGDLDDSIDTGTLTVIADMLSSQSKTMKDLAADLRQLASNGVTVQTYRALVKRCLYASGDAMNTPKPSVLTKKAREALGPLEDEVDGLAQAVADTKQRLMAHDVALKTHCLHRFASIYLPAYAARKEQGGWLDFDDQIQKAEALLAREGVAEWVLYKLDGGIDHILVDEAQDTSPLQWQVIEHLTREFTAGEGRAETGARSIFVVGDLKQSIYSFQGADPAEFTRMQRSFAERLTHIDLSLRELELKHSFRSSGQVLGAVDQTFGEGNTRGLHGAVEHVAFKAALPGRVDLWPVIEPLEKPEKTDWHDPVDMVSDEHHIVRLADLIAHQAREMVDTGILWEEQAGGVVPRPIHAGDILILVQGRGASSPVSLFREIIRACKAAELDVAGADVLKLTEELAVKDIRSTLSFLGTPEDDLALAEALRSPLFGWSEAELFDLAAGRAQGEYLWQALRQRQAEFPQTHAALSDLRDNSDFLRPFDLIERLLTRHDGRRKLVARLGEEVSDGIDALLSLALSFEQAEAPSLTGFLARMEGADVDVKRRAEGRGTKIRVMTVHGSKGLESPIVILPDTGHRRAAQTFTGTLLPGADGTPLWSVGKEGSPEVVNSLKQAAIDKGLEELQRLLYVAMTRAEQWLIVAAAGDLGTTGATWYEQVQNGLSMMGASDHAFAAGPGLRLEQGAWDGAIRPPKDRPDVGPSVALPSWVGKPATAPEALVGTLSPSNLGGAKALAGDASGGDEAAAMLRGTRIHLLLEHLPGHPPDQWPHVAERLIGSDLEADAVTALLQEARHVLENDSLDFLFAPETLAEVDVTAALPQLQGARMRGAIDRLVLRGHTVLAVDFKTNAIVPPGADLVPVGLLRQMGAYAAALEQIYPERQIETAILWTRTAQLMPLPRELVHAAVSGTSVP